MAPELARRHRLLLGLAFAAVYIIWGSTYLAIAFAIQTIPPLLMAGMRFLIAGGALYAWARWRGAPRPRPVQWGWAFFLGALFFLVGNGAVVWVEQSVPSGLVALIVALVSVWTALLEWVRPGGARPSGMVMGGIVLGFGGVALLVLPGQGSAGHVAPTGVLLLMASTFCWALASVLARTADLPPSAPQVSGMEMLAGGTLLFGASVLHGDPQRFDPTGVTLRSGISLLYLVIFGSLVTFTAFAWLLQVSSPSKVATAGYVNPMVAVVLGWALGGESLTPRAVAASLVIVLAVVLIITGREFSLSRLRPAARPR